MVNDNLNWLKPKAANLLIHLLNEKEINFATLQRKVGESYASIYSAINALIDVDLVTEEERVSNKSSSKRTVVISINKKLLEINEIMEGKR